MTEAEMIDEAKKAFIKRGFWPNDVMWACWLDAWKQSALMERDACAKVLVKIAQFLGVVRVYAQDIQPKHELETDKPLHWKARELQDEVIRLIDTTPPAAQRQWIGLTDKEMYKLWLSVDEESDRMAFGEAVQAKLKEKNA